MFHLGNEAGLACDRLCHRRPRPNRVSEVVALKVSDIDSRRMLLKIEQGKGRKDRFAMLPHGGSRWACRALRGLYAHHNRLQQLS